MEKLPHYNFSWIVSLQNVRDASSGDKLQIALFGELSLEEAMDLSRDRQILELIGKMKFAGTAYQASPL
jgi:hypothetical protein